MTLLSRMSEALSRLVGRKDSVRADLEGYSDELGLGAHREFLRSLARPCIEIVTTDAPAARARSKLGGAPDVPADFAWPHHEVGPDRFLSQINLSDLPSGPYELPDRGVLSFFYAHDESGGTFWGDPDYVRVFRFRDADALVPTEPPAAVALGGTAVVAFRPGEDVPPWPWDEEAAAAWPIDESFQVAYEQLRARLHPSGRYLLGYPSYATLAYDPTPGPEWRSLLTLASDDDLWWSWHDGDWLMTFVEEPRLRDGDFSAIRSDAG